MQHRGADDSRVVLHLRRNDLRVVLEERIFLCVLADRGKQKLSIVADAAKIIPAVAAFLLICSFSFAIFSFVFIILSVAVFITVLLNFRPFGLN